MNRLAGCVGILGLASAALAQTGANCLETLMTSNNLGSNGGTVMFDLAVGPNALTFTDIFVHTDAEAGADVEITVYTTAVGSSFLGNELNFGVWTRVATGNGISAGPNEPTLMVLNAPFVLDANTTQGVAIELFHLGFSTAGHRYTNGTGANQVYTNADLTLTGGSATNGLFGPSVFNPRVFNGWLFYDGGTAGCANPPPPPPPCVAVEIFDMTVPSSRIEMDALAVGPTGVSALNAAGIPGPADLARVELPDKPSTLPGVYNTNSFLGNALARVGGVISIIEGASGTAPFDGVTYELTFNSPHTEFGFEVGDWNGPMNIELFDGATLQASMQTATTPLLPQFIQIESGCTFNRATIDTSTAGGNFVLTEVWTQEGAACPCACNFDISTGPGVCDIVDFTIFAGLFAAGDPCACDLDISTGPGVCDIVDFTTFAGQFAAGCP